MPEVVNEAFQNLLKKAGVSPDAPVSQPSEAAPTRRAPRGTTWLPPDAFKDKWDRRPTRPVEIGFCRLGETSVERSLMSASRHSWATFREEEDREKRAAVCQSHYMTNVLARACTAADDVSEPFFGRAAEEVIHDALRGEGIVLLWERYEAFCAEQAPIGEELTDAELDVLGAQLQAGAVAKMAPNVERRVRRILFLISQDFPTTT